MLSDDIMCVAGVDGHFKRVNPCFVNLMEYSCEELLSSPIDHFIVEEDKEKLSLVIEKLAEGETVNNHQNTYRSKSGKHIHISWNAKVANGLIYAVGRDITAIKRAEKELQERHQKILTDSARLCSVGEMALGIGHEIKNPVSIIHLITSRLYKLSYNPVIDAGTLKKLAEQIDRAAMRIDKIVRGLKTLASGGEGDPMEEMDIQEVVEEMREVSVDSLKKYDISLDMQDFVNFRVEGRSSQIAQVVLNLIINSCDAIKEREERWIKIHSSEDSQFYYLHFTDSGKGISEEVRKNIWNSFYTTKGAQGTGLGLPISRKIAEAHGGKLYIDEKCANTRFVLALPKKQSYVRAA